MEGIPPIDPYLTRYQELEAEMAAPDFFQDQRQAAMLSREHQKLNALIEQYEELNKIHGEIADTREMVNEAGADEEIIELAKAELPELEEAFHNLKHKILISMIPPDPTDSRNTIVEIRAGAGGDEASLFVGVLSRMYQRYAELNSWRIEPMSSSPSEVGGFKENIFLVTGEEVYKKLRYESGVHRVQRIPVTESGGRIHTSTVTVAMMPEAQEVDLDIDQNDLDITTMRASGAGGQHVNTTDSAVRIVHIPTGEMVYCADERSQIKNRDKALKVLYSRILEKKQREEQAKYAAQRKSQVGTGDRSERIRTYNYPQGRVTDHRIGLTMHTLPQVLEGEINSVVEALQEAEYKEKLEALLDGKGMAS
ncbi:MAG: peptide chain release factor 1 [Verrucomicrobia bacterium]|nr:peptide chain release factor 1 [Verrucomicrobiota bacterium]